MTDSGSGLVSARGHGVARLAVCEESERRLSGLSGRAVPDEGHPGDSERGPAGQCRPSPARSRFPCPAPAGGPWRALRCALAALAVLAAAGAARAQTSAVLVSNTGQPRWADTGLQFDVAQPFRTGSQPEGYKLTRVDMETKNTGGSLVYTVSIHDDSSGLPGSSLGTLTNPPANLGDFMRQQFTASGDGIDLAANTVYWLVIDVSRESSSSRINLTQSDAEDRGAAAGWRIGDGLRWRDFDDTSWEPEVSTSILIAVYGPRAPEIVSSAVDRSTLTVTFDESLDAGSAPAGSAFTVNAALPGRLARTISGTGTAVIDGDTLTLTLESAVVRREMVTLSYARPTSNPLQDTDGNRTAGFSGQQVTNNTPDSGPPGFYSAAVNGSTLTVTFDEILDTGSAPAGSAFTVGAALPGRLTRTISGRGRAAINGDTLTLTLESAVAYGEMVTLSYARPASNPLQDTDGNRTAGFSGQQATNNTPDDTPPGFSSAAVNGSTLTVTFDKDLAAAANLANEAFTVKKTPWGGREETVALSGTPSISGRTVTLALAEAVVSTDVNVTVSYAKPASGVDNTLQDAAGNEVRGFSDQPVANALDTTTPTFHSAAVNGSTLTVTFDENLDKGSPAGGAFVVSATPQGGTTRTIPGTGAAAIAGDRATVTLAEAVAQGETVVVSYARPAVNPVRDVAGNDAASFTPEPVTNVTGDTTAPTLLRTEVNGARVVMVFDEALDAGSVPTPAQFLVENRGVIYGVAAGGVAVDGPTLTLTLTLGSAPTLESPLGPSGNGLHPAGLRRAAAGPGRQRGGGLRLRHQLCCERPQRRRHAAGVRQRECGRDGADAGVRRGPRGRPGAGDGRVYGDGGRQRADAGGRGGGGRAGAADAGHGGQRWPGSDRQLRQAGDAAAAGPRRQRRGELRRSRGGQSRRRHDAAGVRVGGGGRDDADGGVRRGAGPRLRASNNGLRVLFRNRRYPGGAESGERGRRRQHRDADPE